MSAVLVWRGEVYGSSDGPRGYSCMAHLTGEPCRADVGLCDLCTSDLYCLLEAFVPALVPALDAAAADDESVGLRQDLDSALLVGVGLMFDPVEPVADEGRAWELLSSYYPDIKTTLDLAEGLSGKVHDTSGDPAAAALAKDLHAVLVQADALVGRLR